MKKGVQLMSKIARLAREAEAELESAEDRQAAVEIKLAAECVVASHEPAQHEPHHAPHHD